MQVRSILGRSRWEGLGRGRPQRRHGEVADEGGRGECQADMARKAGQEHRPPLGDVPPGPDPPARLLTVSGRAVSNPDQPSRRPSIPAVNQSTHALLLGIHQAAPRAGDSMRLPQHMLETRSRPSSGSRPWVLDTRWE